MAPSIDGPLRSGKPLPIVLGSPDRLDPDGTSSTVTFAVPSGRASISVSRAVPITCTLADPSTLRKEFTLALA